MTTIIEKPMLFSAPMVRAILDGRKTQTRRIVKLNDSGHIKEVGGNRRWHPDDPNAILACPHPIGSRIWVRETFQPFLADGVDDPWGTDYKTGKGLKVSYPATDGVQEFVDLEDNISTACKPSIFMPRWASRITLEITDVRVQRLQDITEDDAVAEGVDIGCPDHECDQPFPTMLFERLWSNINGAASWEANPWVWAYTFKVVKP